MRPGPDSDVLSNYIASADTPPSDAPAPGIMQTWEPPNLSDTQTRIYRDDRSKYILCTGERASGKSWIAVQKLVKHCYENFNALAIIIVGVKRQALEGGVWYRLETDILPMWKRNVGMQYTDTKTNSVKDTFCFVSNRYGGWSRILLLSMPVESFVSDRVKGMEPSLVLIDEAQALGSDDYFSKIVQQLGRRQMIQGNQQYIATCNPDGPSHWLFRRFMELPVDPETGEHNPDYAIYHVPIGENIHNLPDGYYERVMEAVKSDSSGVEYRRMVLGEWIDRPSGAAIFRGYFSEPLHMRGEAAKGTRILPKPGYDIILGYDLGTANSAISFMQNIPTREKDLWVVFDEMVYTDAYIPYTLLVPGIMRRLAFWNTTCKTKFETVHVSDATAFNMYRATDGTYDSLEVERISRETQSAFPEVDIIKMIECPKFAGSVAARVKVTMKHLAQERLLLSASCGRTKEMFLNLESEKMKDGKYVPDLPFAPRRSKHLHIFDAMSYALLYFELGQQAPMRLKNVSPPELISLGTNR